MSEKSHIWNSNFIVIITSFILLVACDSRAKNVQEYLDQISALAQKEDYDKKQVIQILSEGLKKYPDEIKLLEARSAFYCSHGFLLECIRPQT